MLKDPVALCSGEKGGSRVESLSILGEAAGCRLQGSEFLGSSNDPKEPSLGLGGTWIKKCW